MVLVPLPEMTVHSDAESEAIRPLDVASQLYGSGDVATLQRWRRQAGFNV